MVWHDEEVERAERLTQEVLERARAHIGDVLEIERDGIGLLTVRRDGEYLTYYEPFAERLYTHVRLEFFGIEPRDADSLRAVGRQFEDRALAPWEAAGFRRKRPEGSLSARWERSEGPLRPIYVSYIWRPIPQMEELAEISELDRIVSVNDLDRDAG